MKEFLILGIVLFFGCGVIPNECTDILTEAQCANLENPPIPEFPDIPEVTCESLLGEEVCVALTEEAEIPGNTCSYYKDLKADGTTLGVVFTCADGNVWVCNVVAGKLSCEL